MSDNLAKIQQLVELPDGEDRIWVAELIVSLADPDVDAWVLAGVEVHTDPDTEQFGREPAPVLHHPRLHQDVVLRVVRRAADADIAALVSGLRRLHVFADRTDVDIDVTALGRMVGLTELILVPARAVRLNWLRNALERRRPVAGLEALAQLPALADLAVGGLDRADLGGLAALPHLRRLLLHGSTLADGRVDLSHTALTRLDLALVPGLTHLTLPPTLRELHLADLPDLTTVDGLAGARGLTDLSIVDAPLLQTLPALPDPDDSALRRVRLSGPAVTSIEVLAGRPLAHLDLTGCEALPSLKGFPAVLDAEELSLAGCRSLTEVVTVAAAGAALRTVDLRGAAAIRDIAPLDRLARLGVVALHGTATRPDTVPPALLPACTWAHTPDLALLGARPRLPA